MVSYKNGTPCEKMSKAYLLRAKLINFQKRSLSLLYNSDPQSGDFKIVIFQFVSNCRGKFC